MDSPPSDFRLLRHHSDEYPVGQRIAVWREILARKLLRIEVEPLSVSPFQVDASLRVLPGIRIGIAFFGPSINRRTSELVAVDNDDLFALINLEGELTVAQGDAELALAEGDCCLMSCKQEGNFIRPSYGRVLCARFERARLAALVPELDECTGRIIRRESEALRMLITYLRGLDDNQNLKTAALRRLVVNQIYDLAALVLSPFGDQAAISHEPGLGAGRLRAIKTYVGENLERTDLSLAAAAAACQLSSRQVQRLFETEGTTFSLFLLGKRLARVHAALTDRRQAHRAIGEIALAAGFGDVSHFNRAFRRRYGAAPSEVRHGSPLPIDSELADR